MNFNHSSNNLLVIINSNKLAVFQCGVYTAVIIVFIVRQMWINVSEDENLAPNCKLTFKTIDHSAITQKVAVLPFLIYRKLSYGVTTQTSRDAFIF